MLTSGKNFKTATLQETSARATMTVRTWLSRGPATWKCQCTEKFSPYLFTSITSSSFFHMQLMFFTGASSAQTTGSAGIPEGENKGLRTWIFFCKLLGFLFTLCRFMCSPGGMCVPRPEPGSCNTPAECDGAVQRVE